MGGIIIISRFSTKLLNMEYRPPRSRDWPVTCTKILIRIFLPKKRCEKDWYQDVKIRFFFLHMYKMVKLLRETLMTEPVSLLPSLTQFGTLFYELIFFFYHWCLIWHSWLTSNNTEKRKEMPGGRQAPRLFTQHAYWQLTQPKTANVQLSSHTLGSWDVPYEWSEM